MIVLFAAICAPVLAADPPAAAGVDRNLQPQDPKLKEEWERWPEKIKGKVYVPDPPPAPVVASSRRILWPDEARDAKRDLDGWVIRVRIDRKAIGRRQSSGLGGFSYDIGYTVKIRVPGKDLAEKLEAAAKDERFDTVLVTASVKKSESIWLTLEGVEEQAPWSLPAPEDVRERRFSEVNPEAKTWAGKVLKMSTPTSAADKAKIQTEGGYGFTYVDGKGVWMADFDVRRYNQTIHEKRGKTATFYAYADPGGYAWFIVGTKWDKMKKRYTWE